VTRAGSRAWSHSSSTVPVALFTTGPARLRIRCVRRTDAVHLVPRIAVSVLTYRGVYRPARLTSSVVDVNGVEVEGHLANHGIK